MITKKGTNAFPITESTKEIANLNLFIPPLKFPSVV